MDMVKNKAVYTKLHTRKSKLSLKACPPPKWGACSSDNKKNFCATAVPGSGGPTAPGDMLSTSDSKAVAAISMAEVTKLPYESRTNPRLDLNMVSAHLANERTCLAWTCTGILLMGCGVAVAKMRIAISDLSLAMGVLPQSTQINGISPVTMGTLFLILGLVTIVASAYRYLVVQEELRAQKFYVNGLHILVFLFMIILLGAMMIMHVLQLRQVLE